jgi:hypothetical protein
MITCLLWVQVRKNVKVGDVTYRRATSKWKGYFLLGFIPLYVVCMDVQYVE